MPDQTLPTANSEVAAAVSVPAFTPQRMVDWFSPLELARTGGRVLLASVFGSYADKREVQAALDTDDTPPLGYLGRDEVWFDYVADTGDGFDATYTIAHLLSGERVYGDTRLKRGEFLILGGDQVYPTASREAYRDRMIGPYSAALPERIPARPASTPPPPAGGQPALYAIPGNHDWYDGLTSFVRTFCQGRTLGGWKTHQRRSYFSVPLPHGWWVWGIDIQLEADIDDPQLKYFRTEAERMAAGVTADAPRPKVILITAEPAWVYSGSRPRRGRITCDTHAFSNLRFFITQTIGAQNLDLRLLLAGDLHHYARYTRSDPPAAQDAPGDAPVPTHLVTAGGGGAYASATHHLHEELRVHYHAATGKDLRAVPYRRTREYPDAATSRAHSGGVFLLPWWSRSFAVLLGLTYMLFAWQLQSSSRVDCAVPLSMAGRPATDILVSCWESSLSGVETPAPGDPSAPVALRHFSLLGTLLSGDVGFKQVMYLAWRGAGEAPPLLLEVATLFALLWAFCAARGGRWRSAITAAHTAMHLVAVGVAIWIAARVVLWGGQAPLLSAVVDTGGGLGRTILFNTAVAIIGATAGTLLFAAYLWVCAHALTGAPHMNDVFAARRYKDWKHCLRFHLDTKGHVRVYVIAVDRVTRFRGWAAGTDPDGPVYVPRRPIDYWVTDEFEV